MVFNSDGRGDCNEWLTAKMNFYWCLVLLSGHITFRATGHMWPSVFCKRVQNNIERVHECHSRLGQVAHYFGYITIGMELLLLSDGFVFALCCFIALLSSSNWTVVSWSDAQWSSSWEKKRKRTTPLHFVPPVASGISSCRYSIDSSRL